MAHAAQRIVFVSRASIDVDTNAREVTWKSLGGHADAIRESSDLIELDGILGED